MGISVGQEGGRTLGTSLTLELPKPGRMKWTPATPPSHLHFYLMIY